MKIRVIKAFSGYRIGQIFDWGDGMARIYLGRGMVEEVRETVEAAAVEERCERAFVDDRPKKKKQP